MPACIPTAGGLFLLLLSLGACRQEEEATLPPSPTEEAAALTASLEEVGQRLQYLTGRAWKVEVPYLEELVALQGQVATLLPELGKAREEGPDALAALLPRGHDLLEEVKQRRAAALAGLEAVVPAADALTALQAQLRGLLLSFGIPERQPFPLRTRYLDGWLTRYHESFRFLSDGLGELQSGGDATRFRTGAAGLEHTRREGSALFESLNRLSRNCQVIEGKIKRLQHILEWSKDVLERARQAEGSETPSAEQLAAATAAFEVGDSSLPHLAVRWGELRLQLVREEPGAEAAMQDCLEDVDSLRDQLLAVLLPLSRRLGLADPR